MKKLFVWSLMGIFFAAASCSQYPTQSEGAVIGGAVGAAAGALLDKHNRWRGAVIGAAAGAVVGAAVGDMMVTASKQAAKEGKPVTYISEDGRHKVTATPMQDSYNGKWVRQQVWEDGRLKIDQTKQITNY